MSDIHFTDHLGRKCVAWFADDNYAPSARAVSEVKDAFPDAQLGPSMELGDIDIDQLFHVSRWHCYPLRVQLGTSPIPTTQAAE